MKTYRTVTLKAGAVTWGIQAHRNPYLSTQPDIAYVIFGQIGLANSLAVVPVKVTERQQETLISNGSVLVEYAAISATPEGLPILISASGESGDGLITLFETPIGTKGNDLTGDWNPQTFPTEEQLARATVTVIQPFLPFPGQEIAKGQFGQIGDTGLFMASHVLALMPSAVWFSDVVRNDDVEKSIRNFYYWDQVSLKSMTWEERVRRGFISPNQMRVVLNQKVTIPAELFWQLVEACPNSALVTAAKKALES